MTCGAEKERKKCLVGFYFAMMWVVVDLMESGLVGKTLLLFGILSSFSSSLMVFSIPYGGGPSFRFCHLMLRIL